MPVELLGVAIFSSVTLYLMTASKEELRLLSLFLHFTILILLLILLFYYAPLILESVHKIENHIGLANSEECKEDEPENATTLVEESRTVEERDNKFVVTTVYAPLRVSTDVEEVREMVEKTPPSAETPTEYSGEFADLIAEKKDN